jgi:hypothetical protein
MTPTAVSAPALVAIPSIDELAATPHLAASLPRETAVNLYARCAIAEAALRARLLGDLTPVSPSPEPHEREEWLNAEQVEARFGIPKRWLADHAADLRRRRIVSRPSRKLVVYHRGRLARLLEARCPA